MINPVLNTFPQLPPFGSSQNSDANDNGLTTLIPRAGKHARIFRKHMRTSTLFVVLVLFNFTLNFHSPNWMHSQEMPLRRSCDTRRMAWVGCESIVASTTDLQRYSQSTETQVIHARLSRKAA